MTDATATNRTAPRAFFDRPVAAEVARPAADEMARTRHAHVWRRLAEIQARHRRAIHRRLTTLGKRHADVVSLQSRLALRHRALLAAEEEDRAARSLAPAPGVLPHEPHHRALGPLGLAVALGLCVVADYLVDRSTLEVLLLPLRLTQLLALLVAVVQTLAAHTIGRLLRRSREAVDPGALAPERRIVVGLCALLAVTVTAMAVLRGMFGTTLLALLMFGVGAAAALVAITASYLHANGRLDALGVTERRLGRRGWRAARTGRRLLRAEARRTVATGNLRAAAAGVVAEVEGVYATHQVHLNGSEPAWVAQMRHWVEGRDLPYDQPT